MREFFKYAALAFVIILIAIALASMDDHPTYTNPENLIHGVRNKDPHATDYTVDRVYNP